MAVWVGLKSDVGRLTRHLTQAQRRVVPGAKVSALNKAAAQGLTAAKRTTAAEMGVSAKGAGGAFVLVRANRARPTAWIDASGKAIELVHFKARKVVGGISAVAWGERRTYRGAFVQKIGRHRGTLKRTTAKRLPIRTVWGPAMPKILAKKKATEATLFTVREVFPREFDRLLRLRLSRAES